MPTELRARAEESDMKKENVRIVNIGSNQTPINFMDALAILFIGLKLTDHLQDWSWVEVLAPLWAPIMLQWFMRLVVTTFFAGEEEE